MMMSNVPLIDPGKSPQIRFNVMVCGESGSGKTTFCLTLFKKYLQEDKELHNKHLGRQTLSIEEVGCFELKTTTNQSCFVHLFDSRGYGDFIDNKTAVKTVKEFLWQRHLDWLNIRGQEATEEERAAQDGRIHSVFYFFGPHRIKAIDKLFLSELKDVVNIVPIVGKSDVMTIEERRDYLLEIRQLLKELKAEKGVNVFDFHEDELSGEFLPDPYQPEDVQVAVAGSIHSSQFVDGNESPIIALDEAREILSSAADEEDDEQESPHSGEKVNHTHSDDEVIVESKISFHSPSSSRSTTPEHPPTPPQASSHIPPDTPPNNVEANQKGVDPALSHVYGAETILSGMTASALPMIPNVFAISSDKSGYRVYPWGKVETENPRHSDVPRLRSLVFEKGYINQLRSVTQQFTAHIYRQQRNRATRWKFIQMVVLLVLGVVVSFLMLGFRRFTTSSGVSSLYSNSNSNSVPPAVASPEKKPTIGVPVTAVLFKDGNFR